MRRILLFGCLGCFLVLSAAFAKDTRTATQKSLEKRQKVELMGFFLKDPSQAELPKVSLAVNLYNQAVRYFQTNEFELAKQTLGESLEQDELNPLAYELLGDIYNLEANLKEAKAHYQIAYNLQPSEELKKKLEKMATETQVDKKLSTYHEEHFIIKYQDEEVNYEGYELRDLLRSTYRQISKDFAYYFRHKVAVLLYDEADFRKITNTSHWVAGLYDGKVRMPINRAGFTDLELKALTAHEVTHAFVAGMSARRAPSWINEGLASYEENKVRENDLLVFRAAIKTNTLFSLDELMGERIGIQIQDPLRVALFYQQSFHLTRYLVERYGMFRVKNLLAQFGKGRNSDEAVRAIFKISVARLEKEWKETL